MLATYLLLSYTTNGLRGKTHTLTLDLAESLVGESVGNREKRGRHWIILKHERNNLEVQHEKRNEGEKKEDKREPR